MKKNVLFLGFLLLSFVVISQNETAVWYFGYGAGIDFSSGEAVVITDGVMEADAGCASISDENGQLLFYTNGKNVWNRAHRRMPNGFGLNGSELVNQNSIIIPMPETEKLYYLFTINAYYDSVGLNYSLINMELDGGKGDVETSEKNVFLYRGFMEKITAVNHCNEKDVWIVGHDRFRNFYSFLLSASGISADTVKSVVGSKPKSDLGYLKVSPTANRIALPINNDSILLEVFYFDNRNGKVSEPLTINKKHETVYAYGIEFSPDGRLLYVSTGGSAYELWQYDLTLANVALVNQEAVLIATGNNFAMQQALDGKIYIAKENRPYLNRIVFPNLLGTDCNFEEDAIYLAGGESKMGLPNFQQSFFLEPSFSVSNTCFGDSCRFHFWANENVDSLLWDFGDELTSRHLQYPDTPSPFHYYSDTGSYHVQLVVWHCQVVDTINKTVRIYPYPSIDLGNDTSICSSCGITLDSGDLYDALLWKGGSEERFFTAYDEGLYWLKKTVNACSSFDSIYIYKNGEVMVFPTAFSPNGDGLNDEFKAVGNEAPMDYQLVIYNRWGHRVFESRDINYGWDGSYRGEKCESGTYIWKLSYAIQQNGYTHGLSKEGHVLLLR